MQKAILLGSVLALALTSSVYAQSTTSINAAEKGSLATVAAIDKNEILVSIIAENKKVNSDVADFAKMMISQHGNNLTQILEMETQLKTGPLTGGESDKLAAKGKKDLIILASLKGTEFEHAYANAMVEGHEAALNLIDTKLMKTAKNEEIKTFLTDTRAAVVMHLEHAKKMQADLKS